jgi:hypothetical protein
MKMELKSNKIYLFIIILQTVIFLIILFAKQKNNYTVQKTKLVQNYFYMVDSFPNSNFKNVKKITGKKTELIFKNNPLEFNSLDSTYLFFDNEIIFSSNFKEYDSISIPQKYFNRYIMPSLFIKHNLQLYRLIIKENSDFFLDTSHNTILTFFTPTNGKDYASFMFSVK